MRNEPKKLVCGFAIALLVSFGPSHAGTVVSNLDETVAATAVVSAGNPFAQEFNAGGGGSFELSSIVAALGGASGSFTASAELVLVANNLPDNNSVVATFTASSIGSSFGDVTFTPTTSVTLSRNVELLLRPGSFRERILSMAIHKYDKLDDHQMGNGDW